MLAARAWREAHRAVAIAGMQLAGMTGRAPRLPPGSLGPSGVARLGDDRFYLRKLQRYGPVFKVLWVQNLATCVVGFERARRLFALHAHAMVPITIDISPFVPKGFLRCMARDQHPHYRSLFLRALPVQLTTGWEPELRTVIRAALTQLAGTTSDGARSTVTLIQALDLIATRCLLVQFFGLRPSHETFAALEAGYRRLGPEGLVHPIGQEQRDAFEELRTVVWQLVRTVRENPAAFDGDSALARLVTDGDGNQVDETVVGNLIYMIEMGRFDIRSLLRWVLKYLSDHPDVVADLGRGQRPAAGEDNLAEACVLETLRLDQAEALNRIVREEFVFEGYRFPRGTGLRVLLRETHRDATAFADPDRFSPGRFAGKSPGSDVYAPFGVGEHRCIVGSMVVRLSTLFVEELVANFTWTVLSDGPRHRGRFHWEPSPAFAIGLTRRPAGESPG